eukprot:CAMPEP_0118929452 /NCGR_PEP_ID=MMETSP1169-20130426/6451_1 /TAXON_ID=36882 /ORGANISM="Pyramimonas obovata, Strain CCMP722" /LENGTH=436 /DNA_ID=CAMNT_0006871647 /DNA_START=130 /DNA_END=1436 /DNA_ORIENTATION=-
MAGGSSGGGDADGTIPEKHRSAVETIVAVTGASEDEAYFVLKSCNYDVDETTNKLLDSPFETFTSKAKKKSDAKKAQPKPMAEPKRPIQGGRDFGSRGGRGDGSRGGGFGMSGRGGMGGGPRVDGGPRARPMFASAVPVAPPSGNHGGEMWGAPSAPPAQRAPSGGSDARAPLYNRAGPAVPAAQGDGWDTPSSLSAPPVPPAPIRPPPPPITAGSGRSVADILKASTSNTSYHNPQPPTEPAPQTTAAPALTSFLSAFQAQDNIPKGVSNSWSSKPKAEEPAPSASTQARYNGQQAEVAPYPSKQALPPAIAPETTAAAEESAAAPPPSMHSAKLQFGDFGSGFGDGFGDGLVAGVHGLVIDSSAAPNAAAPPKAAPDSAGAGFKPNKAAPPTAFSMPSSSSPFSFLQLSASQPAEAAPPARGKAAAAFAAAPAP